MSVSCSDVKRLLYGSNIGPSTPATFLSLCERIKSELRPEDFNPMIAIFGGVSIAAGKAFDLILFGGDWIQLCVDAGTDSKNALICLASNYDDYQAMVAYALEMGMIAGKPGTEKPILLDGKGFGDLVKEVFCKNYGGIQAMSEKWGIMLKPGLKFEPAKTRSVWRAELGYDVLIHPVTLEPCRDTDGTFLRYEGLVEASGDTGRYDAFGFIRKNGESLITPNFPKTA